MTVGKWRRRAAALTGAALLLVAGSASADPPSPQDRTLAESLFRDAKKLVAAGKYKEACPMLAESQRLDPAGGTLLNLASCHASAGMTATAWGEFSEALAEAKRVGRADRVKAAEAQIAALEPKLARMTVAVNSDGTSLADVELDARPLPSVSWGRPFPVDPGRHVLKEHATGRLPYETTVEVGVGEQKAVTLPPLAPEVVAAAPALAEPPPAASVVVDPSSAPPSSHSARLPAGIAAGAVGVVGIGIGSYLALHAIALHSDSDAGCTPGCTQAAVSQNNDARTSANIANVGFGVGVAGLAVGAYLIVTSRREVSSPVMRAAMALFPRMTAGPRGAGFAWEESF
jgi:hypothetical protein